jgi:hypothetical protein
MKLIDYIQNHAKQFTIYALLDMLELYYKLPLDDIPGFRIENNQQFLTQQFNEVDSIEVSSTNIVLKINSPNFLNYIPTNYIHEILESHPDSSFIPLLFDFFNIWTHRIVIIGYRIRNIQYLPTYPKRVRDSMYESLLDPFQIKDLLMLITRHRTVYCLEQVLCKAFRDQATVRIKKLIPRRVLTNFNSRILGTIVLGKSTYLLDQVIIKITCYHNELFSYLKNNPELIGHNMHIKIILADHLFLKGKLGEIRLNWNNSI